MHGKDQQPKNVTKLSRNRNLIGVLAALFGFGLGYNSLVAWLERTKRHEGYMSIMVIIGTAVTIAASAILNGTQATLYTLACFAASGAPMALGSMWRHAQRRTRRQTDLTERIHRTNGQVNPPPTQGGTRNQI